MSAASTESADIALSGREPSDGIYMEMDLVLKYGFSIRELVREIQQKVSEEIERLTALNIRQFNVTVKSLVVEKQGAPARQAA